MAYKIRTRDEHLLNDGSPKRILALDGGGLRGILTLSMDDSANMPTLQDVGARAAKQQVRGEDFPSNFDLVG
jgi:hypothetical protein